MTALDGCFNTTEKAMTALDGCFSTAGLGAEWYKKDVSSPFGILWPMKNGRSDNKSGRG